MKKSARDVARPIAVRVLEDREWSRLGASSQTLKDALCSVGYPLAWFIANSCDDGAGWVDVITEETGVLHYRSKTQVNEEADAVAIAFGKFQDFFNYLVSIPEPNATNAWM